MAMLTRRTLIRTGAPICSSFSRIVPHAAVANGRRNFIKQFYGSSKNAVKTRIRIAVPVYT